MGAETVVDYALKFKDEFGAGSSPLVVGDRVVLCQDHDTDSFLTAIDKRTATVLIEWVIACVNVTTLLLARRREGPNAVKPVK